MEQQQTFTADISPVNPVQIIEPEDLGPVELGDQVHDPVYDITGIVVCLIEQETGNVRLHIQPKSISGLSPAEGYLVDSHRVKVLVKNVVKVETLDEDGLSIPLGAKVKDTTTGFVGRTVARETSLNGCVFYDVTPRVDTKKPGSRLWLGNTGPSSIAAHRLEILKMPKNFDPEALDQKGLSSAPYAPAVASAHGGPMVRVKAG